MSDLKKGLYYSILLSTCLVPPNANALDFSVNLSGIYGSETIGLGVAIPYVDSLINASGTFNGTLIGTQIGVTNTETINLNGPTLKNNVIGLERGSLGAISDKIEININSGSIGGNVSATADKGGYNGIDRRNSNIINLKGGTVGGYLEGGAGAKQNTITVTGGILNKLDDSGHIKDENDCDKDNGGGNDDSKNCKSGTIYAGVINATVKNKSTNGTVILKDMNASNEFLTSFTEGDNGISGMIFGSNITGNSDLKFDGVNGNYQGGFKDFDIVTITEKSLANNVTNVKLTGNNYHADNWAIDGKLDTNGKILHGYKNSTLALNVGATGELINQFISDAHVNATNLGKINGILAINKNLTLSNTGSMTGNYQGNTVQITNNLGGSILGTTALSSTLASFLTNSGTISGNLSLSGLFTLNNQSGGNISNSTITNNQTNLTTNNSGTISNTTFVNADDTKTITLNNQSGGEIKDNFTIKDGTMNLNNQSGGKIHDANITSDSATLNIDNNGKIYGTNSINSANSGITNLTNNTNGELTGTLNVNGGLNNFLNKGNYHDLALNNKQNSLTLNNQGTIQGTNSFNNDTDAQVVNLNNQANGTITGNLTVKEGTLNLANLAGATMNNANITGNSAAVNVNNAGNITGNSSITTVDAGSFINTGHVGNNGAGTLALNGNMTADNAAGGTIEGKLVLGNGVTSFVNHGILGGTSGLNSHFELENNSSINTIDNFGTIDVAGNLYNKFDQNGGLLTLNNKGGGTIRGGLEMLEDSDLTINNESGAYLTRPNLKGTAGSDFVVNNFGRMEEGFTMTSGNSFTLNNKNGGYLTGQNHILAANSAVVNNELGGTMENNQFYNSTAEFNINNKGLTNNIEVMNQEYSNSGTTVVNNNGVINFNNQDGGKLTGYFGGYGGTVNLNNDAASTLKDILFVNASLFDNQVLTNSVLNINNSGTFEGNNRLYGVIEGNINLNNKLGGNMTGNMDIRGIDDPVYMAEDYFLKAHITNELGGNLHDFNITNATDTLLFDNAGNMYGTNTITSDSTVAINNNNTGEITGSLTAFMPELIINNNNSAEINNATLANSNKLTLNQHAANEITGTLKVNSGGAISNQSLNLLNDNAGGSINTEVDANIKDLNIIGNNGEIDLALNANSHITGTIGGTNTDTVKITNAGMITGNYTLQGGTADLINATGGVIGNEIFNVASGTLDISNSGTITGNNSFTGTLPANITLANLSGGLLEGNMTVNSGLDAIGNEGTISNLALNNLANGGFTINNSGSGSITSNNSFTDTTSLTLNNTDNAVFGGNTLLNAPLININQSSSVSLTANLMSSVATNALNLTNTTKVDGNLSGTWGNITLANNNTTDINVPGINLGNTGTIGGTIAITNGGNTTINNGGTITGGTTINNGDGNSNGNTVVINNTGNMSGNINDSTSPDVADTVCLDKKITINNSGNMSGDVDVQNNILVYNNNASGMVTSNHINARDLRLTNAGTFTSDQSYLFNIRDHMEVNNSGTVYGRDYAFMLSGDRVTGSVNNTGTIWSQGTAIGYNGQNLPCANCYNDTFTLNNSGRIIAVNADIPGNLSIPDLDSYAINATNMNVVNQSGGIIGGSINVNSYTQDAGSTWIAFMDKDKTLMSTIHAKDTIDIAPDSTLYIYTNNDVKAFTDGQKFKLVTADNQSAASIDAEIDNYKIKTDSPFANYGMESLGHDGFITFNNVAPTTFATATDMTTANHNNTILGSQRVYELFVNRDTEGESAQGMASGDNLKSQNNLSFMPIGGYAKQDDRDGHAGYDTSYYGGIGYFEHDFSSQVKGGLGFAYMNNNTDYNDVLSSKSEIKSYRPFAYINYEPGNWRFDVAAGVAKHKVDNNRFYSFNDIGYLAKSKYDADEISGHLNVGYKFQLDNGLQIQPIAGLYAAKLKTDSYNEEGNGPMNMHVDSDDYNSLKTMLGMRFKKEYELDNGVNLTPEMHVRWYHETKDTQGGVTSYFLAQEQLFNAQGIKAPKDIGDIALRLRTNTGGKWDLFTEAYYQFGSKFYNAGGTVGLQYNF